MAEWASLTNSVPRSMEWRILRAMDSAYLAACREMSRREHQSSQPTHTHSERPMTPELFDAIF